jgi:hypothetical protein
MERRHPLPLAGEGHRSSFRLLPEHVIAIEAGLFRGHEQGDLGRVANRLPAVVLFHETGPIGERCNAENLLEQRLLARSNGPATLTKLTCRLVGRAGDGDLAPVHDHDAHRHLSRGQCACLVRTHDRCRAKRLDRRQPANERLTSRHARHTNRQCDRCDGGQSLRDRGDGERDRGLQHETPRNVAPNAEQGDDRRDKQCDDDQAASERIEPMLEWRSLIGE